MYARTIRSHAARYAVATVLALAAIPALAAETGLPWEGPMNKILTSITGPVARVLGAMAIIGLGLTIAFSEGGSILRKVLWVVLGLVVTFNAVSWALPFLGFTGGLGL